MRVAGLRVPSVFGGKRRRQLGEPVPHGEDWWITTSDVKDYAAWLNRRVDDTAGRFGLARASLKLEDYGPYGDPFSSRAITFHALEAQWLPWEYAWKQWYASVTESWWARVNAWDTIATRHAELVSFRHSLRQLGMVDVPPIAKVPTGPEAGIVDHAKKTHDKLTTYLGVAAVVGVGIFAWRSSR
jgi:hypothetical protein